MPLTVGLIPDGFFTAFRMTNQGWENALSSIACIKDDTFPGFAPDCPGQNGKYQN
jgi:hypothetical protein